MVTARCPLSLLEDDQELEDEDEESESEEPEPEPEPESESESESDEASFFGSAAITVVDAFAAAFAFFLGLFACLGFFPSSSVRGWRHLRVQLLV